jgi:hypothetical protein
MRICRCDPIFAPHRVADVVDGPDVGSVEVGSAGVAVSEVPQPSRTAMTPNTAAGTMIGKAGIAFSIG